MSMVARWSAAIGIALLLCGACSRFGDAMPYCNVVADLQQQWGEARALEAAGDVDIAAEAYEGVEYQFGVVARSSPAESREGWEALAGPGDAGTAGESAIEHADAQCGSDLAGIADGLTPQEREQYLNPAEGSS